MHAADARMRDLRWQAFATVVRALVDADPKTSILILGFNYLITEAFFAR